MPETHAVSPIRHGAFGIGFRKIFESLSGLLVPERMQESDTLFECFRDSGEQDMEKWTVPSCSVVSLRGVLRRQVRGQTKIAADKANEMAYAAANFS